MEEYTNIEGTVSTCAELEEGLWYSINNYLRSDATSADDFNYDVQSLYMMRPIIDIDCYFMVAYYTEGLFPRVRTDDNEFTEESIRGKWTVLLSFQSYQIGVHFRLLSAVETAEEGFNLCNELKQELMDCASLLQVLIKCSQLNILPLTIKLQQ